MRLVTHRILVDPLLLLQLQLELEFELQLKSQESKLT